MPTNNKEITSESIEQHYDTEAPIYDSLVSFLEVWFLTPLRKKLISQAQGKTLEVAVGTGINFSHYSSGVNLVGIDLSQNMLKLSYNRSKKLGLDIDLQKMNSEKLLFADHTFDTVVSTLAMCTFADPIKALTEMARVLKPAGHILLLEHGLSNLKPIAWFQRLRAPKHLQKYQCHLNRDHLATIKQAGFTNLKSTKYFFGIIYLIDITL